MIAIWSGTVINESLKESNKSVRTLYTKKSEILPNSPEFFSQIYNKNNENFSGRPFAYNLPNHQDIMVPSEQMGISSLHGLIKETKEFLYMKKEPKPNRILEFFLSYHLQNAKSQKPSHELLAEIPSSEHTIETNLYFFANNASACGDASIAASTLMRTFGYKTRLVLVSNSLDKLDANHVFFEYFSETFQKWIMIDIVTGFVPMKGGNYLSSFEFFQDFNKFKNTDGFKTKHPDKEIYPFYFSGGQIGYIKKSYISEMIFMELR